MKQKNVILMVVAVGCGLVAAFLTSAARSRPVEQVEVLVAAKDLPVGTTFTAKDMDTLVKRKAVPKDSLPAPKEGQAQGFVLNADDLLNKQLGRPMREGEVLNPNDLNKGLSLPKGHDLVSMSIGAANASSGFIQPGSRIDVRATVRLDGETRSFKLLCDVLVITANHDQSANGKNGGAYADLNQVGMALTEKQTTLFYLAQARNCDLKITLRHTEKSADDDKDYKIDDVIKLLEDKTNKAVAVPSGASAETNRPKEPTTTIKPVETIKQPEPPVVKKVKVWVANRVITPGTDITRDLIETAFRQEEREETQTGNAMLDFSDATGQVFVLGVDKDAFVTKTMVGKPQLKPVAPQESIEPKPTPEPKTDKVDPPVPPMSPVKPPETVKPIETPKPTPAKPQYVDVTVTGPNGTIVHRFEVLPNGTKRKVKEFPIEQAQQEDKPEAPKAAPQRD